MVTGAAVRLTGSGLGCPKWPNCEPDSFIPRTESGYEGWVEFGNRLVTGLVMAFTLAAVFGARWRNPRRDDLYRWSLGLPAWVLSNAIVGAFVVAVDLAPVSVIGHFLLSLGAVWNAVVLHHKAGEEPSPTGETRALAAPAVRRACNWLLVAAGVVLVTGTVVTGSGPHAGDADADRLPFNVGDVARVHGVTVMVFLALTLAILWMAHKGDAEPAVQARLRELLAVIGAQGAIGYTQYFAGVPAWLVALHVLGAAAMWIAVLRVRLSLDAPLLATSAESTPEESRSALLAGRS
jgi:heme a synthase